MSPQLYRLYRALRTLDRRIRVSTQYACEMLEPRTLLTVTINGTSGDDLIEMIIDNGSTEVVVNGQNSGRLNDPNIIIDAGLGNDTIFIEQEFAGRSVTVAGGAGDNTIMVGSGRLTKDVQGDVHLEGTLDDGNDQLVVNDGVAGGSPHGALHLTLGQAYEDGSGTIDSLLDGAIDASVFNLSSQPDVVYIDQVPIGMQLNLGDGQNVVHYGGTSHVIHDLDPGQITGGVNTDQVIFDDSNGDPSIEAGSYMITAAGVMGQSMTGIENVEIDTRSGTFNDVQMYGDGGVIDSITLNGSAASLGIGYPFGLGVDLDSMHILLNVNLGNVVTTVHDQDADNSNQVFLLYTTSNGTVQRLAKGNFNMAITSSMVNLTINGGTTDDSFGVGGVVANSYITVSGGNGNDSLYMVDLDGHLNEIAPTFIGKNFEFDGGLGIDTLTIDDSGAAAGDGEPDYLVTSSSLVKYGSAGAGFGVGVEYDTDSEKINLVGDSDNNLFTFTGAANQLLTLNGYAGNDIFSGYFSQGGTSDEHGFSASIIGGAGNDTLDMEDSGAQGPNGVTEYDVNGSTLGFDFGAQDFQFGIDNTLENYTLDENNANTTTKLTGMLSTLKLTITGGTGNNTFIAGGGDIDNSGFLISNTTVSGGTGNDSIEFDDHLDDVPGNESETYNMDNFTLSKGGTGFTYNGFEQQTIDAANVVKPLELFVGNTFNINSTNGSLINTTINGGDVRPCIVNVTPSGFLSGLTGSLTLNLGTDAEDAVTINDQNSTLGTNYILSSARLSTDGLHDLMSFAGVDSITLNASAGNNSISITSAAPGTAITVNAGAGDDAIYEGSGVLDQDLIGGVSVDGGSGADSLTFDNHSDNTIETQTLTAAAFTDDQAYPFSGIESLHIIAGPGGGTINLNNVAVPTLIDGNSGADIVNIGNGNLDINLLAAVTVNGAAGNDSILFADSNDTGNDNYQFFGGNSFRKVINGIGKPTVLETGVESRTLQANSGNNGISVLDTATSLNLFGNAGNDTVITDNGTDVTLDTGGETTTGGLIGDAVTVNDDAGINFDFPATVKLITTDHIGSLTVNSRGTYQLNGTHAVLDVTHDLTLSGVIDVAGGFMIDRNASSLVTQFSAWIKGGYANGAWNGTTNTIGKTITPGAINSSLAAQSPSSFAVGFAPASAIFNSLPASFGGQSVTSTAMLVRYTTMGDANLDGVTNALDFNALATNFGATGANWYQGDFNYDGKVNTADFNALATNFNARLPATAAPLAATTPGPRLSPGSPSEADLFGQNTIQLDDRLASLL